MILKRFFKYISLFLLAILIVISLLLIGLKQILEQSTIKSFVKVKVENILNITLNFETVDTVIFPYPGISMHGITVFDGKEILNIENVTVTFDISRVINSEFQIRSVSLENGYLLVERLPDGSFPLQTKFKSDADEIEKGKETVEKGPKELFRFLPKTISIQNISIRYQDDYFQQKSNVVIQECKVFIDREDTELSFTFLGDLNQNALNVESELTWTENHWKLNSLVAKSQIKFVEFKIANLGDLSQIFPKAHLSDSVLNSEIHIEKGLGETVSIPLLQVSLQGIKNKRNEAYPEISLESDLSLNEVENYLKINRLNLIYKDAAHLAIQGKLLKDESKPSEFTIKSNELDIDRLSLFSKVFSEMDLNRSVYFQKQRKEESIAHKSSPEVKPFSPTINFLLDTKKIKVTGKNISYLKGSISLQNPVLKFNQVSLGIFEGEANLTGNFHLKSGFLSMNAKLAGINIEKAIGSVTSDKLLKGKLRSNLSLELNTKAKEPKRTVKLRSEFHIGKGQLLGYANFIKPVAEVGKLFNFSGAKGESTEFESIDGSLSMANQTLTLHSFEMQGIGLNALGNGVYNENGKIDMKFTVGLSGMVGKAVKLPIIYKGYYGKNFAYIDPVWLTYVYTGTMLGGPAGTILGSVAGTRASDGFDKSIDFAKDKLGDLGGFLFGDKNSEMKKETSKKK
ncbi:hypothetical protein LPTSP4_02090 [Leptospira ryugenii]|uniref:Uncharacterized protein n=1 Tax=Leptospira ryugenii TaxID=1917863 RepID=A0A2P2DVN6_9LEPT|nr:AsmA-like C-terminal region-containing protein [Leptospira ryugenii]GBF48709.1 hypothetical protein LPTSP4_02090 [Leptospira ryugenii]